LSINPLDTLFVADTVLHQVVTLSVWGVENRVAGDGTACADPVTTQCASPTPVCGDGGPAVDAQLNGPVGIDAFSTGLIYLGDTRDQRVRILQAE